MSLHKSRAEPVAYRVGVMHHAGYRCRADISIFNGQVEFKVLELTGSPARTHARTERGIYTSKSPQEDQVTTYAYNGSKRLHRRSVVDWSQSTGSPAFHAFQIAVIFKGS